jgi:hypothetical protein
MMVEGAFIQLESHLKPLSTQAYLKAASTSFSLGDETEETFDPEQVRELGMPIMMS